MPITQGSIARFGVKAHRDRRTGDRDGLRTRRAGRTNAVPEAEYLLTSVMVWVIVIVSCIVTVLVAVTVAVMPPPYPPPQPPP